MLAAQIWRVYQRGLEQWLADLLQPTFDGLVEAHSVPAFVKRLKIVEFTVDHAAPYFTNVRRRTSRKVSQRPADIRVQDGAALRQPAAFAECVCCSCARKLDGAAGDSLDHPAHQHHTGP